MLRGARPCTWPRSVQDHRDGERGQSRTRRRCCGHGLKLWEKLQHLVACRRVQTLGNGAGMEAFGPKPIDHDDLMAFEHHVEILDIRHVRPGDVHIVDQRLRRGQHF